jgi:hypothetical protein
MSDPRCQECDRELACFECGRCRDHCRGDVEGCLSLDGTTSARHDGVVLVRFERDLVSTSCGVCHVDLGARPRAAWVAVAFDEEARPYSSVVGCHRHREEAANLAYARLQAAEAEGRELLARGARPL